MPKLTSTQPTPQQTDDTSCGVRVIANYSLRAQGFSVGGWSDLLDPERLRMELVGNFQICIADNAMRKGRDREELRRSKRLKTVAE